MQRNVFSVVVLCYKHFEYIKQAISSVLSQDYASVELVVSDDGSANFPKGEIESFIRMNQGRNITRVLVRQEEHNVGTVRHLNHAKECCTGEYIAFLAGDDVFASNQVLSKYVEGFEDAPENCYIQMAQTGMYDENLEVLENYYLKPFVAEALMHTTEQTDELMRCLLLYGPCLPSTSTCFRHRFFEKFGSFNETYKLVEDYPMHIRLAEERWIIHYHNFVAIKHRHGGISHGQIQATAAFSALYYNDLKNLWEKEVLTRLDFLIEEDAQCVKKRCNAEILWIKTQIAKAQGNYLTVASLGLTHPLIATKYLLEKLYPIYFPIKRTFLPVALLLWLVMPTACEMVALVTGWDTFPVQSILYRATWILAGIWALSFLCWCCITLIWKTERFPPYIITIE